MTTQRQFFIRKPRIENQIRDLFIFLDISLGSSRNDVAKRYEVSPCRVSQIRHRLYFEILHTILAPHFQSGAYIRDEHIPLIEKKMIEVVNQRINSLMAKVSL